MLTGFIWISTKKPSFLLLLHILWGRLECTLSQLECMSIETFKCQIFSYFYSLCGIYSDKIKVDSDACQLKFLHAKTNFFKKWVGTLFSPFSIFLNLETLIFLCNMWDSKNAILDFNFVQLSFNAVRLKSFMKYFSQQTISLIIYSYILLFIKINFV